MMSLTEVASHFKVHLATVKRWIKQGRLRASKVGPRELVRRSEVERIERLMQQGRF
ncbi:MAG: hypothetical protein CMO80_12415 [Verrucomicrobiales bacterium]|nr:hypothetical protein [Verrucomicrobiales bacterium]|tara:strand:+ start:165 stop:332 length:168 start_codon:yes stop_codon:yes gene_type:complete